MKSPTAEKFERSTASKRLVPCDEELVLKAMAGDKEAFSALFQKTYRPIRRAIREILHREEDVNDAMQNTYIKAFKYLPTLRHPEAFYSWLKCTAENCARDVRRAVDADNRRLVSLEEGGFTESFAYDESDGSNLRTDVNDVLTRLNPRHAEVLILYYFVGMRLSEIARALHEPPSTVRSRFTAAKRSVLQMLEDKEIDRPLYGGTPVGVLAAALNDAVEADVLAALNAQTAIGRLADVALSEKERQAVRRLLKKERDRVVRRLAGLVAAIGALAGALATLVLRLF